MVRTVYVNGEYLPETEGKISIFDRGFLFADGVYEVSAVVNGKLVDYARPHGAPRPLAEGTPHGLALHPRRAGRHA